jgi:transcriptional regulator with XRE-family HTH domain
MGRSAPGTSRGEPNLDLLKARIERGLSRADLGFQAGVSGKQIRLIERGDVRRPQTRTKYKLARALESSVLSLFPLEREPVRGGRR